MKESKFPKLKKKLKGFLTEESWKISKKDALGLWVASAALMATEETALWSHSNYSFHSYSSIQCNHVSGTVNGHYNVRPNFRWNAHHHSHNSHGSHGSHGSRW